MLCLPNLNTNIFVITYNVHRIPTTTYLDYMRLVAVSNRCPSSKSGFVNMNICDQTRHDLNITVQIFPLL